MTFSIVTPSYNQGRFIERTLQSVWSQSLLPMEHIVMDGGSKDETLSILKRYSDKIRYFSEPDRGQSHAINKALALTSGDIIGWLNSDDVYCEGALQKVADCFERFREVDVVYGQANHIDEQNRIVEKYPTQPFNLAALKNTCFLSQPAVFFRRRVIEQYGVLDERLHYCMDYEFWLRLARQGAVFFYLPDVLACTRLYPETKTCRAPHEVQQEAMQMLHRQLGYVPFQWLLNYAVAYVKNHTPYRKPQWQFIASVYFMGCRAAFHWNGLRRGIAALFCLPFVMARLG